MNFYASLEFLGVVADTYFEGKPTTIENVRVGSEVLRLLVVDGKTPITGSQFLDYHAPLRENEIGTIDREVPYAERVARGVVEQVHWEGGTYSDFTPAPYLDWSMFPSFEEYRTFIRARRKGKVQKLERLRRQLVENVGELVFCSNDQQDDVIDLAIRWKSSQLRDSGVPDYFANPQNVEFFHRLRASSLLKSSTLRSADGRLLSIWLGFEYDNIWSGWIFTYDRDPEIGHYSPGHQLVLSMLEESKRKQNREFDFSIGSNDYKWVYATHVRLLDALGRPPVQQRILTLTKREAKKLLSYSPTLHHVGRTVRRALRNYGRST